MGSALLTFLGGAVGAAIVGGIFSLIQHRLTRKDKLEDQAAEKKENDQERRRSNTKPSAILCSISFRNGQKAISRMVKSH